jgi:hypothetical protein
MVDKIGDNLAGNPESEFPTATFPTCYADGVSGYLPSSAGVKFFLYRSDPNMFGRMGAKANPFVQVVMPIEAFARSVALFDHAINALIKAEVLSQAQMDQFRLDIEVLNQAGGKTGA